MIVKINDILGGKVDFRGIIGNVGNVIVEAGFGSGDFMLYLANKYPASVIIGVEVSERAIEKLKRKVIRADFKNIRIVKGNIRDVLKLFPDASIDYFCCNFPDPWWKKRHKKRRIFNKEFVSILFRKMKSEGIVEICTDHIEYAGFIIRNFEEFDGFLPGYGEYPLVNFSFREFRTKYEKKFLKVGKTLCYFKFLRP